VSLESELSDVVGPAHVVTDSAVTPSYETDWTRRFSGRCRLVVRPGSTAEVVGVLAACARARAAVVVQGGNTGLVGGSVPAGGEVLLSMLRLRGLGEVDRVAQQVTVSAGATLADVQAHVRPLGFEVGVDLASRDSATIGGMAATNAGGLRVLRYGSMRQQVAGLEAVLASGSVLEHLDGLAKEATGYDLSGLLAGSEGTLAVLTRIRLRLVPVASSRAVALLGLPDTSAAVEVLSGLRRRLPSLDAAEVFYDDGLTLVRTHAGLPAPLPGPHQAYLLVECAELVAGLDAREPLLAALAACAVDDAVVVADAGARRELWRYREAHTEAINAVGVPVKLDVCVAPSSLADFVAALPAAVRAVAADAEVIVFGHLAEGNLHVNVLGVGDADERVTDVVLRLAVAHGGSISAEHGIGRAKVGWLGLSRSPAELAAMVAVKKALDPNGLLNPGVLLPSAGPVD
jgi:FAD/FMN-containing dehydrogenase